MPENRKNTKLKARGRGIYLLPNLFTTAALFAGFYGIILALNGHFSSASVAVLTALVLDGLDGRVARMTNTSTAFGAEYDSMSDMVSFGIAPAIIMYQWSLSSLGTAGFGQLGWVTAFLYTACTALRLARFNVQVGIADKRFFQGLACPSAAALMVLVIWVSEDLGIQGKDVHLLVVVLTISTGLLMVSNFTYYSFKDIGSHKRIPFMMALILVLLFVFTSLDPPKMLMLAFATYALSGPGYSVFRWFRKRARKNVA